MFTHFYSDPHFGHSNVIEYCKRPFEDVGKMNLELIRRYNDEILPYTRPVVLWLGDCFFHSKAMAKTVMLNLHGEKWLVKGNHDKWSTSAYLDVGFAGVLPPFELEIAGHVCTASHYPPKMSVKGRIHLHGHCHGGMSAESPKKKNYIDLGVDCWAYSPISLADLKDKIGAA